MSIVEHERQAEEVEGPITEREHRARILEGAALEIEFRGWTQGTGECGQTGAVCLLGAIAHASGNPAWAQGEGQDWNACGDLFGPVPYSGFFSSGNSADALYEWNDKTGRTADDVVFILRWRAEEIRDGR